MSQSQSGFLQAQGAPLYYEVAGQGQPLLLLHAGIADSRMWDQQFETFARQYRVIRFDLRGFGQTTVPEGAFANHEDVAALLAFLGIEKAHIIAVSFGGKVALDFTLTYPEKVASLVLVAPLVGGEQPSAEEEQFGREEQALLEQGDLAAAAELNVRTWVAGPMRTPEQVDPAVRQRVYEMQYHAFTVPIPDTTEEISLEPPAITRLAEIRVPTLLIVGNYDLPGKQSMVKRLAAELPQAQRVVIPNAAHIVNMEQPEEFNKVVLDFLARSPLPSEFFEHYASGYESQRLESGTSQIELVRTQELVMRYVPSPPAVIFDVGGGPGVYACWLAKLGYEVHLVDAMPLHVELARQASQAQPDAPLASIEIGDARSLMRPDTSVDVVLLFGPLYHLTERADRLAALREAHRILRPGGILLAVGISRFTSSLDGMRQGLFDDPIFAQIVERDLADGQHRNPTSHPAYFTTAFFHHPRDLEAEVVESGFLYEMTLPIEGPLWLSQYVIANFSDQERREQFLSLARRIEEEPSLLGASAHLLAIARKT